MNPVAMLMYNSTDAQLELSKEAVASVLDQDILTVLWIANNGSTAPTGVWLDELLEKYPERVVVWTLPVNTAPTKVTNDLFRFIFNKPDGDYILGVPNDIVLPSNAYSQMLKWPRGIVTASQTGDVNFPRIEEARVVSDQTPLAVGLIRRWAWKALVDKDGFFLNEKFFHYASDLDFALRISACGIRGIQLDLQYWHSGSASWRMGDPIIARRITDQANVDRETFERIYGFPVSSPLYAERCGDINFRGEGKE